MKRILIIEDNKDLNRMLKESLSNVFYAVFSQYTGIDGLEMIKRNYFDLILLDIMLPYKSGDEILREVRLFSEVPVIIISAKDMARNKIDLLKLGADDYITKPFDLEEVEARVEAALRRCYRTKEEDKIFKYKDIILNDDINFQS